MTGLEDIVDNLGPLPHQTTLASEGETAVAEEVTAPALLSERQEGIIGAIDLEPTSLDTIIERTELAAEIVMQELTMLSLRGVVKRVDNQNYVRKNRGG